MEQETDVCLGRRPGYTEFGGKWVRANGTLPGRQETSLPSIRLSEQLRGGKGQDFTSMCPRCSNKSRQFCIDIDMKRAAIEGIKLRNEAEGTCDCSEEKL